MAESKMKQIIVMRKDLGMRKGKMVAQGAHASMAAILPYYSVSAFDRPDYLAGHAHTVWEWLSGSFTKVCVSVDSEEELLDVYQTAHEAGLIAALITDSGLTEFNGVPTKTCCAIGPATEEQLAPITGEARPEGRLKLL